MQRDGPEARLRTLGKELTKHYLRVLEEMPQGGRISSAQRFVLETKEVFVHVFGSEARLFWKKYPQIVARIESAAETFAGRYPYQDTAAEVAGYIMQILRERENRNPELGTLDETQKPESD